MDIFFIKPSLGQIIEDYNLNDGRMEPLQLAILAALIPETDTAYLYDDRMEEIPFNKKADLVCITVDSFTARRSYQIAKKFRKKGVPVVLGGVHTTLLPDEAEKHADAILIGDAESVFGDVIEDARNGRLQSRYVGIYGTPQKAIIGSKKKARKDSAKNILPRRDLFKGKGYLEMSLVQFSRGCKFNCSFCSVARFFKKNHNCRRIKDVVEEIREQDLKHILFVDDNLIMNKPLAKELMKELIPLKVRWATQASIDMVNDKEMMDLMVKSRAIGHLIGFESINVNTLKWLNKPINHKKFDEYQKALNILRDHGLQTWGSFMIGNDFDTKETISETVEFAIRSKLSVAWFHVLMPYPGTKIYDQFKKEGRLLYDNHWWNHKDFRYNDATFEPKLMTKDELKQAAVDANKRFYSIGSIMSRMFDLKTNIRNPLKFYIYSRLNYILRTTSI